MPTAVIPYLHRLSQQTAHQPTLLHTHGFVHPLQTRYLLRQLSPAWAVLSQHHGELPWRGWRSQLQKWGLRRSDGFLFAAPELAQPWLRQGMIADASQVFSVMETSSLLTCDDKTAARARTGLYGHPILLWTGNLNANKDPITILKGFRYLLHDYPQSRLYMAFREETLLPKVRHFLADHASLQAATTLLGRIPYDEIGDVYNSADLFVQGSSKEGSGIALLDALACGVIPVVTDIPAFRTITGAGQIGALWPIGDADAFYRGCLQVLGQPLAAQSQQARLFFEQHWSFGAIGHVTAHIYETVLAQRTHPTQPSV